MDIEIYHNGTEISDKVLSYNRTMNICTGIGTATFSIEYDTGISFNPWDILVVYEGGIKKQTFYVSEFGKGKDSGILEIKAQDGSIKLSDYFIPEQATLTEPTNCRYWIEKFLDEATITYNIIPEDNGGIVAENTYIGLCQLYDFFLTMLQQSGWYFYFDEDGVCVIGNITKDLSNPDLTVYGSEIVNLEIKKHDKNMRNRAVVWGNYSGGSWVFADSSTTTGYETSANDIRTTVVANSYIYSASDAQAVANSILDEYANVTIEKIVSLAGYYDVIVGDIVSVSSKYYSGTCMVYELNVNVGDSGVITTLTLDAKCPRLFGFYGFTSYVYTGTLGQGVWRKRLDSVTWEDFSTGLNHYNVTDLAIKNNIFACIADGWVYVNTSPNIPDWNVYDRAFLWDNNDISYPASEYSAIRIDVDDDTGNILIIYSLTDAAIADYGYSRAWLVVLNPDLSLLEQTTYPIVITTTNENDLEGIDVANYQGNQLVSVVTTASGGGAGGGYGIKATHPFIQGDENAVVISNSSGGVTLSGIGDASDTGMSSDGSSYGTLNFVGTYVEGTTTTLLDDNFYFSQIAWDNTTKYSFKVKVKSNGVSYAGDYVKEQILTRLGLESRTGIPKDDSDRDYIYLSIHGEDAGTRTLTVMSYTPPFGTLLHQIDDARVVNTSGLLALEGLLTIDGVTLDSGDRVLLTNQANTHDNGVWYAQFGSWIRTADTIDPFTVIGVSEGAVYANTVWEVNTITPAIEILQILVETKLVNEVTVASAGDFDDTTLPYSGILVNNVYYFARFGKDGDTTVGSRIFRYDCETNTNSDSLVYSYVGTGYVNLDFPTLIQSREGIAITFFVSSRTTVTRYGGIPSNPIESFTSADAEGIFVIVNMDYNSYDAYESNKGSAIGELFTIYTPGYGLVNDSNALHSYNPSIGPNYIEFLGCKMNSSGYHSYVRINWSKNESWEYAADGDANDIPDCIRWNFCPSQSNTMDYDVTDIDRHVEIWDLNGPTQIFDLESFKRTHVYEVVECPEGSPDPWEIYFSLNTNDVKDATEWELGASAFGATGLYSKDTGPYYIFYHDSSYGVYDANSQFSRIGTLTSTPVHYDPLTVPAEYYDLPANVSLQIDDFDSGIYIWNNTNIVKEAIAGGVQATYTLPSSPLGGGGNYYFISVTNGLIIFHGYDGSYTNYTTSIYKLPDNDIVIPGGSSTVDYILSRNGDTFDIVDDHNAYEMEIEVNSDILLSRTVGDKFEDAGDDVEGIRFYTTYPAYTSISGTFQDARILPLSGSLTFEAGSYVFVYNKYGLVVASGVVSLVDMDTTDQYPIYVTTSGYENRLETSNGYNPQYIFIYSPDSFRQRYPTASSPFYNHSSGMPTQRITCIRLDDKV